jgi:hypothetical protein
MLNTCDANTKDGHVRVSLSRSANYIVDLSDDKQDMAARLLDLFLTEAAVTSSTPSSTLLPPDIDLDIYDHDTGWPVSSDEPQPSNSADLFDLSPLADGNGLASMIEAFVHDPSSLPSLLPQSTAAPPNIQSLRSFMASLPSRIEAASIDQQFPSQFHYQAGGGGGMGFQLICALPQHADAGKHLCHQNCVINQLI